MKKFVETGECQYELTDSKVYIQAKNQGYHHTSRKKPKIKNHCPKYVDSDSD